MRGRTTKPLIVYPNSGEVFEAATTHWSGDAAMCLGTEARHWQEAGARLIGGCCRTTPSDIRNVKLCTHSESSA
jgi:homocysteine S-methyltransferase